MRLSNYLNKQSDFQWEGMDLINFISWFEKINISRKPKNVSKTDHELLKEISKLVSSLKHTKGQDLDMTIFELKGKLGHLRVSKEEIESNYKKSNNNPSEVKGKHAKYIKTDTTAYSKFKKNIENIEDFLSELKGYHSKPLKDLVIRFVDTKDQKVPAKYIEREDVLQVNTKKAGNTKEEYGSLRYIILHELGHRYLRMFPQTFDYSSSKWITTKYSGQDTFSDEEKFSELFAMSHWKSKYSQFKDKIEMFEKSIK